jgi:uridine kinase
MLIIGITGGSGSGKTTFVKNIIKQFPPEQLAVISLDSYYRANRDLSLEERAKINFDHPDSIEFNLLHEHLQTLKNGKPVEKPVYDFITSTRKDETVPVSPKHVILVEGILLFSDEALRNLFHLKVYVDAEPDDRLMRIIHRDTEERGRNVQDVLTRYQQVKTMHLQFIEPTKRFADLIVPHGGKNQVAVDLVASTIRAKLGQEGVN